MKISIICPSLRAEKRQFLLDSIKRQTVQPDEVVIFDGPGGFGYSRNKVFSMSGGDIVIHTDDDVVWKPKNIEKIKEFFEKYPDRHILQGRVVTEFAPLTHTNKKVTDVRIIDTAICAMRRHVLDEFKFDEKLRGFEAVELALRVKNKYKIWYDPEIAVYFLPKEYEDNKQAQIKNMIGWRDIAIKYKNPIFLLKPFKFAIVYIIFALRIIGWSIVGLFKKTPGNYTKVMRKQ